MVELYDEKFLSLLGELNTVVANVGDKVEGNLFYHHEDPAFPNAPISQHFAVKRENLLAATLGRGRVLEIGTNAGHSALWMLHHNPKLHYTGVDICRHRYTMPAVNFLKSKFPERVDFHAGDSLQKLPEIAEKKLPAAFDVVHIDGMHTTHHVTQDFHFSKKLCVRFAWIIFDDTDMKNIADVYDSLVKEGQLLAKKPEGWVDMPYHRIGMLPE